MGVLRLISPRARKKISKEKYKELIKELPQEIDDISKYSQYFPMDFAAIKRFAPRVADKIYKSHTKSNPLFKEIDLEQAIKLQKTIARRFEEFNKKQKGQKEKKEIAKETERLIEQIRAYGKKDRLSRYEERDFYKTAHSLKNNLKRLPGYKLGTGQWKYDLNSLFRHDIGPLIKRIENKLKHYEEEWIEEDRANEASRLINKGLEKGIKGKFLEKDIQKYVSSRHLYGKPKFAAYPPNQLYHTVSYFEGADIIGVRGGFFGTGIRDRKVLSPKEYVGRIKKILNEGLKVSLREEQVVSDQNVQAIYFLDAPHTNYGLISLEVNSEKFDKDIFRNTAIGPCIQLYFEEYMIYIPKGKHLKADYKVVLNASCKGSKFHPPSKENESKFLKEKTGLSFDQYMDELRKELKKAKIPFEEV